MTSISNNGPHLEEGARLRKAREAAGLSLGDIVSAARSGWTLLRVSDIEHGRIAITANIRELYQRTISTHRQQVRQRQERVQFCDENR